MKDSEFDALLRSALLEAARLDAEALTEGEPEAPPRSLEYQAEMAALLRDPIRGDARPKVRPGLWQHSRLFRSAACLALGAVLCLGSAVTFSPSARAWVVHFFSQRFEDHSAFSFQGDGMDGPDDVLYRPTYLPAGYMEDRSQGDLPEDMAIYVNDQEQLLYFSYMAGNTAGTFAVDNEHSTEKRITIGKDCQAHLLETISPDYPSFLIWMDEEKGAAFLIDGYVSPEELIRVAESVQAQ